MMKKKVMIQKLNIFNNFLFSFSPGLSNDEETFSILFFQQINPTVLFNST
jgi:hypothetical protein